MIRLPGIGGSAAAHAIEEMTGEDVAAAADLHRQYFANAWTDGEIGQLLQRKGVLGFVARRSGRAGAPVNGFVLLRIAADEAEILTIAVAGSLRRRGIGRALMDSALRYLHAERIASLFLEVSWDNAAAIALYRRLGFRQVAIRPDYYAEAGGQRAEAIVMRCDLS